MSDEGQGTPLNNCDETLVDLAQHLAYHASVGFAECRGLSIPADVAVDTDGRTEGRDVQFEVQHGDKTFQVTVDLIEG